VIGRSSASLEGHIGQWYIGGMKPLLCLIFLAVVSHSALIPPAYVNSVVALGAMQPTSELGQAPHLEWFTEASGFFYGYLITNDPVPAKRQYEVYLVTNRHVIEDHLANHRDDIRIRVNPAATSTQASQFTLPANPQPGQDSWFFHPNLAIDIAAIRINVEFLKAQGVEFDFIPNDQVQRAEGNSESLRSQLETVFSSWGSQ
jgi:hypothetical protein